MTEESKPELDVVENHTLAEEAKAEPEKKQEEVIPKKYVTEIVKRERLDAYHKGKREAMEELKAQQVQETPVVQPQESAPAQAGSMGLGGMPQVNPADVQRMIAEAMQQQEAKRQAEDQQRNQLQHAQQIASAFNSQMASGSAKKPDFDEKMKDIDFQQLAPIAALAADTGMADEIMYDLVDNPQKITHLMILAHTQPKMAQREMVKLAASIKENQAALKQNVQRDPLDTITPSTVGTDNGDMSNMSVADFRKMF